jgi:hypothetical protein
MNDCYEFEGRRQMRRILRPAYGRHNAVAHPAHKVEDDTWKRRYTVSGLSSEPAIKKICIPWDTDLC